MARCLNDHPLLLETLWGHSGALSDPMGVLEWCRGIEKEGQEMEGLCQKGFWPDGKGGPHSALSSLVFR